MSSVATEPISEVAKEFSRTELRKAARVLGQRGGKANFEKNGDAARKIVRENLRKAREKRWEDS